MRRVDSLRSWPSGDLDCVSGVEIEDCQPVICETSTTSPVNDNIRLSPRNQHGNWGPEIGRSQRQEYGVGIDNPPPSNPHGGYRANEGTVVPSRRRAATAHEEAKLVSCCSCCSDGSCPYQRGSRCAGMRRYVLTNVAVLTPVINECKLKERHVHAAER